MEGLEAALYQKTLSCVHCGLCLPACPAYEVQPRESLAPRGQVYNIRAVLEGRLELTETLTEDIYACLACRGCESVCPAGVPVGSIMEDVRGLITERRTESAIVRTLKRWMLEGVLADPRRLTLAIGLLRVYELLGLRRLVGSVLSLLPGEWDKKERLFPSVPPRAERRPLPIRFPSEGTSRGRVGLFTGCIASHLFAEANRATARVLQRNSFEVVVPDAQGCCGALHLHNGLPDSGRRLAEQNVRAFRAADVEAVVVNAAGCGAALSEYGELLNGSGEARDFAERVVDISAFLVRKGFRAPSEGPSAQPSRVAYDAPCHLFHAQRVQAEPRELLSRIPGVDLLQFRDPERCCGSAGIYNVTHYEMSMKVLDRKMEHIRAAEPDVVATGNPGCHMQLSEGVRRSGMNAEVVHPVVLLERAYQRSEKKDSQRRDAERDLSRKDLRSS